MLTPDQVRPFLLHDDELVRERALVTQGVSKHCINAPGYQAAIGLPSATRLDSKFPRLGAALLPSGHRFTVRDPSGLEVSPARCRLVLIG